MSQQDELIAGMFQKKKEKQQTLRENIKETIKASMPYIVWNNEDYYDGFVDHILQNVVEWVEDQAEKENHDVDIDNLILKLKREV